MVVFFPIFPIFSPISGNLSKFGPGGFTRKLRHFHRSNADVFHEGFLEVHPKNCTLKIIRENLK